MRARVLQVAVLALLSACATPQRPPSLAHLQWPAGKGHDRPAVEVGADGKRSVVDFATDPAARQPMKEAEAAFLRKDCSGASVKYLEVLSVCPRCYLALSGLGDCEFLRGQIASALDLYDRALSVNPLDGQLHFFRGSALFQLGRLPESRDALLRALALKPRHQSSRLLLAEVARRLGQELSDEELAPRVVLTKVDGTLTMVVAPGVEDGDRYLWQKYVKCQNRLEVQSREDEVVLRFDVKWRPGKERACLSQLEYEYRTSLLATKEPALDRLVAAQAAGHLDDYLLYEVESRIDPDAPLRVTDAERERLLRYLASFLLRSAAPAK
jgi:tetratricopeptide (TPR) repeat protein